MAKRHRDILDKLDPIAVNRYNITEADIETVEKYLGIIQANMQSKKLWQQIVQFPSGYATSLVVHEIVEIRLLQARGIDLFKVDTSTLQQTLATNIDAHTQAIYDEHLYLQDYINRHYKQLFQIGTLLKVNREDDDEEDFQLLLYSDIGVFIVEASRLEDAQKMIDELKGDTL
jgi:hypothetical protein